MRRLLKKTEISENYYNQIDEELRIELTVIQKKVMEIYMAQKELYEINERGKHATIERLMTEINDLNMRNNELKMKNFRIGQPENAKNDRKSSKTSVNRLDHRFIKRYPERNIEMLVSKLEVFFKEIMANGRNLYKIHKENEKSGYTMLNYMRVEGNIKSMKIHLANKLIGIKHEYPEKKQELTIKMRKHDPMAIQWHKKNLQSNLRDLKWKMEYIKATLDTLFSQEIMESFLISLAYLFFSFQYNNQQLLLSGNSSFPLEEYFPEVYNLDIIEWIFQHFVGVEASLDLALAENQQKTVETMKAELKKATVYLKKKEDEEHVVLNATENFLKNKIGEGEQMLDTYKNLQSSESNDIVDEDRTDRLCKICIEINQCKEIVKYSMNILDSIADGNSHELLTCLLDILLQLQTGNSEVLEAISRPNNTNQSTIENKTMELVETACVAMPLILQSYMQIIISEKNREAKEDLLNQINVVFPPTWWKMYLAAVKKGDLNKLREYKESIAKYQSELDEIMDKIGLLFDL
ncbi:hypothetical protein CAEBREN_10397 [Caenorhabditis brenneri]|uniref:Uncharacterized protein n=1 Tax=Caenorhabditis brenneri TaxID=135651 RepID=G0N680_CAEBE|nr:hypothetical protein CAEBREN_10397 [Caenorhabditis brenneri]